MVITVTRKIGTSEETNGEMSIDGKVMCYTLEDQVRPKGEKVYGETAIPEGRYPIWLTPHGKITASYNIRFKDIGHDRGLYLANVPGFEGIMIHCGNTDKDTLGCILVGLVAGEKNGRWYISESSAAYRKIYPLIQKAFNAKEKIIVEVKNEIGDAKDKDGKLNLAKLD